MKRMSYHPKPPGWPHRLKNEMEKKKAEKSQSFIQRLKEWWFGKPVIMHNCKCGDLLPDGDCVLCHGTGETPFQPEEWDRILNARPKRS